MGPTGRAQGMVRDTDYTWGTLTMDYGLVLWGDHTATVWVEIWIRSRWRRVQYDWQ